MSQSAILSWLAELGCSPVFQPELVCPGKEKGTLPRRSTRKLDVHDGEI